MRRRRVVLLLLLLLLVMLWGRGVLRLAWWRVVALLVVGRWRRIVLLICKIVSLQHVEIAIAMHTLARRRSYVYC